MTASGKHRPPSKDKLDLINLRKLVKFNNSITIYQC